MKSAHVYGIQVFLVPNWSVGSSLWYFIDLRHTASLDLWQMILQCNLLLFVYRFSRYKWYWYRICSAGTWQQMLYYLYQSVSEIDIIVQICLSVHIEAPFFFLFPVPHLLLVISLVLSSVPMMLCVWPSLESHKHGVNEEQIYLLINPLHHHNPGDQTLTFRIINN